MTTNVGKDTLDEAFRRVRAGLARAKSEGKKLGRPPIPAEKENAIREALNRAGRTEGVREIAARFGGDPGTVQRISRPFAQKRSRRVTRGRLLRTR